MKKLLILALMAVMAMPTLKADEVRQQSGVYSPDPGYTDPAQTQAMQAEALPVNAEADQSARSQLALQLSVLDAAAMAATSLAERQRLEEEMQLIKQNAERQRLEDRLAEVQNAGLNEEAARLSQLLQEFDSAGRPVVAGATIPRDNVTGEALDGAKGGAR
jgi:murein L,D-transpeptidase YcbB/YkuD